MALQTNGLIIPRGMVLPLKLFQINGGSLGSASTIVNKLKEHPVEFKERKYYEGFSDVDSNGNMISVYYTIGQPITVHRMKDGEMTPQVVYSQGKCEYIIHVREKFLECRGTSWVVKKGLTPLMEILGVEFDGVHLDENSMVTLCRNAALVKTVQISDLDNPALSQIQLSGEILDSAEWTIYRRQGTIRYFRGFIDLPTGGQLSAQVTNKGSMLIYKRGVGIPAEDVIAAVNMIMKLAKT
ncbi:MAG: hypothetical protein K9W42_07270 [Candidatus Heimdallarchaeota archaeon]|nr:hypothetical protein [Candidatus Heimdallarchaeota archaeon]